MNTPEIKRLISVLGKGLKNMEKSIYCPNCRVYSNQNWSNFSKDGLPLALVNPPDSAFSVANCHNCKECSYWANGKQIYPRISNAPTANDFMPEDVKMIFNEARLIYEDSPRSAAALLRLSIQLLMIDLGESGKNINTDIGNLGKKGLPVKLIRALDIVRVTGNDAIHPGVIDVDNKEIVLELFNLVNLIIEKTIEENYKIDKIYDALPDSKKEGINNRDNF